MHEVAREFACAAVRSKDAQKQLARTSLINCAWYRCVDSPFNFSLNQLVVGTVRSGKEPLV